MTKDNGNWLAAEQAVLPDGTLREDLPLVNRKLPALNAQAEVCSGDGQAETEAVVDRENGAG